MSRAIPSRVASLDQMEEHRPARFAVSITLDLWADDLAGAQHFVAEILDDSDLVYGGASITPLKSKMCPVCGEEHWRQDPRAIYCSVRCNRVAAQRAHRARKKAAT